MTNQVEFENALDELITEMLTEEDIAEFEEYYEDTTLISIIKESLRAIP